MSTDAVRPSADHPRISARPVRRSTDAVRPATDSMRPATDTEHPPPDDGAIEDGSEDEGPFEVEDVDEYSDAAASKIPTIEPGS